MSPELTANTPGKKLPINDQVQIPTLNIGDSITISASTPLNWHAEITRFSFYTKEYGDDPLTVGFCPKELLWKLDPLQRRGRLDIYAGSFLDSGLPFGQSALLKDYFNEGDSEHAWFTIKNEQDSYTFTFPKGTIKLSKIYDGATDLLVFVKYKWDHYPTGASAFSDAVIQ